MRALVWSFPTTHDVGPRATLCVLLGLLPCAATAQEAVISGKVTGTQGELLAGAIAVRSSCGSPDVFGRYRAG